MNFIAVDLNRISVRIPKFIYVENDLNRAHCRSPKCVYRGLQLQIFCGAFLVSGGL